MKVLEKIKKGIIVVGTFLLTIPAKVLAADAALSPLLYGPPSTETLYGLRRPSGVILAWKLARTFIIPLALVIGLITYFKKSKSSKKKKILVITVIIIITAILYFVVNKMIFIIR